MRNHPADKPCTRCFNGPLLRTLRAQRGLNQKQLAAAAGLASSTVVSALENGTHLHPRAETVHKLAGWFRLPASAFDRGTAEPAHAANQPLNMSVQSSVWTTRDLVTELQQELTRVGMRNNRSSTAAVARPAERPRPVETPGRSQAAYLADLYDGLVTAGLSKVRAMEQIVLRVRNA